MRHETGEAAGARAFGVRRRGGGLPLRELREDILGRIRELMKKPVVVDGRNIYDPAKMYELGFRYRAVGRSYAPESNGSNGVNGTNGKH